MTIRRLPLLCLTLGSVLAVTACKTTPEKEDAPKTAATKKSKPPEPTFADQSQDVAFQAFLGRLRKAVQAHDIPEVAEMMTKDFGYRLDPVGEGDGVFAYWDQNNIWPELELVLNMRFVPRGKFMVAPIEFVSSPDEFTGYRAGIALINGSWKFAYFVSG